MKKSRSYLPIEDLDSYSDTSKFKCLDIVISDTEDPSYIEITHLDLRETREYYYFKIPKILAQYVQRERKDYKEKGELELAEELWDLCKDL